MQPSLEPVQLQAWQLYLIEKNKDGITILQFDSQSTDYDNLISYANYVTKQGGVTYIIPAPGEPNASE